MVQAAFQSHMPSTPIQAPIIILVHTQAAENIGMCARAMLNCGLDRLRLVRPRDGWPNPKAVATSANAQRVIDDIQCFDSVAEAVADCHCVYATTARSRELQLPTLEIEAAVEEMGQQTSHYAILFGPEASGLDNEALSYADRRLVIPANPEYSSLNLAQAVLLIGWEWWRNHNGGEISGQKLELVAQKKSIIQFLERLEGELDRGGFFKSPDLRPDTIRNLRVMINRSAPSERELRMLHGIISALTSNGN